MFKRYDTHIISNPHCTKAVDNLIVEDFYYYDKDGFELNRAEQKFYAAMQHPINYPILNHCCWQEPWFELERNDLGLILDHSMILVRCDYHGAAQEQLEEFRQQQPLAQQLLNTKPKWGFDFDLNAVADDGTIFEVLHVEFDSRSFEAFRNRMITFDYTVRHTDWQTVAADVWAHREHWQTLKGFEQNHWKAQHILGWARSEYTEKAN